jgi:hypothetical protein
MAVEMSMFHSEGGARERKAAYFLTFTRRERRCL